MNISDNYACFLWIYFCTFIFRRTGIKSFTFRNPTINEIALSIQRKLITYSLNYDDWQNWDAGPIRKNANLEFRTIGTMANYEEHTSDWLRFHGEFYCFHGSFKLTELDQCKSIARHIHIVSYLWQSALQQHFSTRLNYKVKLKLFFKYIFAIRIVWYNFV